MFENFPYTDVHQLNLDWIIKVVKDFLDKYEHIEELIANGEASITSLTETSLADIEALTGTSLADIEAKKNEAEALLQAWYDTHSADIANQLATALSTMEAELTNDIAAFNTRAQAIGESVIASIPADYTNLAQDVLNIQTALFTSGIPMANENFRLGGWNNGDVGMGPPIASDNPARAAYNIQRLEPFTNYIVTGLNSGYNIAVATLDANKIVLWSSGWQTNGYQFNSKDAVYFMLTFKKTDGTQISNTNDVKTTRIDLNSDYYKYWFKKYLYVLSDYPNTDINTFNSPCEIKFTGYASTIQHFPSDYPTTGNDCFLKVTYNTYGNSADQYLITQELYMPLTNTSWRREFRGVTQTWGNWSIYRDSGYIFNVGPSRTYTRLRDGIARAIRTPNSIVRVDPGLYDLTVEFAEELAQNPETAYGIILSGNVTVIFDAGAYVKAIVPLDANKRRYFAPFIVNGSFTLDGLNIEVANTRYCVHDDNANLVSRNTTYKNCIMKNHSAIYTDQQGDHCFYQCIGGGMGVNQKVVIENCVFDSMKGNDSNCAAVSYHNGNSNLCDGALFVSDSYFKNLNGVSVQYYGPSQIVSVLYANNNSFGRAIACIPEIEGVPYENFTVLEWNNVIR